MPILSGPASAAGQDCCHRWANTGHANGDQESGVRRRRRLVRCGQYGNEWMLRKRPGSGDGRYENSVAVCFLVIPMIPHRDVS